MWLCVDFFLCYFRPKKSSLSGWVSNPFPSCRLRSRTVALAPARLPLDFCWSADRFFTTTVFHQELTTQTMPRTALLEYSGQFMLLRRRNCCNSETTGHFVWCHHVPPKAPESSALYPRSQEYQHCSSFGAPGTCRLVHVMCMWYIICCQVFFAACSVASLLSTVAVIISASSSSSKGPDTKIGSQNRNPNPDLKIKISIKTVEFTQRACILAGLGSVQVLKRS